MHCRITVLNGSGRPKKFKVTIGDLYKLNKAHIHSSSEELLLSKYRMFC